MAQLLILGNGFDLQCGLKSSYKDFFESCIKNKYDKEYSYLFDTSVIHYVIQDVIQELIFNKSINFWEIVLYLHYKKNLNDTYKWCDVEKIIKEILCLIYYGDCSGMSNSLDEGIWKKAVQCYETKKNFDEEIKNEIDKIKKFLLMYCVAF